VAVADASGASGAGSAAAEPPRFDVVRVGARGMLVAAGRAAPGAEVTLIEDGQPIGRARADVRGEWVILPAAAIAPGSRQFSLRARPPGGEEVVGAELVAVVVPEAAAALAAAAQPVERRPDTPLVVLVPGPAAAQAPRVLQGTPGPAGRLALDIVDYDTAGAIRFAGSAPAGATVRVYVNDGMAGDAVADAQGRWALTPAAPPAVGRHTLRLDQLAASGSVAARIEVPFQRDRLPEMRPQEAGRAAPSFTAVVQPGDSLWRLARSAYGSGTRFTVIYDANRGQIRNPDVIFPGQVFTLPSPAAASLSR
jgi:nucleoid-associated protein YgaU